ncbi:hypothetical protein EAS64_14805 [Trebonia kvetii]|uniref:Pentapeptide repeat-containing protein n=2 Tax=Trebonia kvetii TaxID=2480626 RepID=A0A6P2C540_9ACTN|nr:hypothetical protein EAS64_14805 [Trebonia kvetii]
MHFLSLPPFPGHLVDFTGADLSHADLTRVGLMGADLSRADLTGAKGFEPVLLDAAGKDGDRRDTFPYPAEPQS